MMWLNHDGRAPVQFAVALANDPPASMSALAEVLRESDLDLPRPPRGDDLRSIQVFIDRWLTVVDAAIPARRALRLNELLAQHAAHPRLTDHRGTGWHLHFRDDDCPVAALVATIATVGTALHLIERGMHRLGRCAAPACTRVWADLSRPGTQRYCSSRCANTDAVRRHRLRSTEREAARVKADARRAGAR